MPSSRAFAFCSTLALVAGLPALAMGQTAAAPNAAPAAPNAAPAAPNAAPAPAAPVHPRTRFAGAPFLFAGGPRERANVEAAIERAIDGMNFITKPIARGRLKDRNPVVNNIVFNFPPGQIEIISGGRPIRSGENNQPGTGVAVTGERLRVNQRFDGQRIVQILATDEGARRNEYYLSPDNRTLTMRVTVTSGRLPHPLTYALTFRR